MVFHPIHLEVSLTFLKVTAALIVCHWNTLWKSYILKGWFYLFVGGLGMWFSKAKYSRPRGYIWCIIKVRCHLQIGHMDHLTSQKISGKPNMGYVCPLVSTRQMICIIPFSLLVVFFLPETCLNRSYMVRFGQIWSDWTFWGRKCRRKDGFVLFCILLLGRSYDLLSFFRTSLVCLSLDLTAVYSFVEKASWKSYLLEN